MTSELLADPARHLEQDAVDLGLLFIEQPHQFVVLFDGLKRLDKYRLPAGTCAVDHALHTAFLLDFDWDYEALAAYGDQLILHRAALGQPAQIAAQGLLDRSPLALDLAPDSGQFGRGPVFERAVRLDLVAEASQELGEIGDARRKRRHRGPTPLSSLPADSGRSHAIPPPGPPQAPHRESPWFPGPRPECALLRRCLKYPAARKTRSGPPRGEIPGFQPSTGAGSQSIADPPPETAPQSALAQAAKRHIPESNRAETRTPERGRCCGRVTLASGFMLQESLSRQTGQKVEGSSWLALRTMEDGRPARPMLKAGKV